MKRALKVVLVVAVGFAAAQLIRPSRANPPIDVGATLESQMGTANGLAAVLDRSCRDCHSNKTEWPGYARVAPLSWVMASAVKEGRKVVNFSEWGAYPMERRHELLRESCAAVSDGKMPGSAWVWLHPEAKLSAEDVNVICTAARHPEVAAAQ